MSKIIKWIVIELIIFAVFITGAFFVVTRYIQPYMLAQSNMPKNGGLVLRQLDDGMLEISWPEADRADYYLFQVYQLPNGGILSYQNDAGKLAYEKKVTDGNAVRLRADAYSGNVMFRVSSACGYTMEQKQYVRMSDNSLQIVTKFDAPAIEKVTCHTDPIRQTATIYFQTKDATVCHISVVNEAGENKLLKNVSGDSVTLSFGEKGDLPVPAFGENVQLHFSVTRENEDVTYYSTDFETLSIDRTMLVPSDILLEYIYEEQNCWLNWQEEECDYYEIQALDPATGAWSVHGIVNADEERKYHIGNLEEDMLLVLRVTAAYEKEMEGDDGQIQTVVKYRSISNEIGIKPSAYVPKRTQVDVSVLWDDVEDQDGKRPDSATIKLLANGEVIDEVILDESTGWSHIFEELLVYISGQKVIYSVAIDTVTDYTTEITENTEGSFTVANTYVPAPDSWMGTVTINNLRIRGGAGYNYSIVDYLQRGDRIEILEIIQVGTDLWGRIENGWVAMEFVLLEGVHQTVTITINNLRIRDGAGLNYAILGYLQMGDQVEILETKLVDGVLWGRIEQGWISLEYGEVNEIMP